MRKPKVIRMVFALFLGCFIMVIFYFNSSLKPASEPMVKEAAGRSRGEVLADAYDDPLAIPANEAHIPGNCTSSEYSTTQINQRPRRTLKFARTWSPSKWVGKYETLEQDSATVAVLAGWEDQVSFLPHPRAPGLQDMYAQFFHNISPFTRRTIQLHRMDFLLFNYSIPAYQV
ncbi:carbohydrate sulfotransferase 11 [Lates japonicus]|uniref:Carbohydrate sulfotransferase 11 n=1 Tax=Lates japonicus TaxID=270547 RepID=A0AAD3N6T6_LATJO|nr:carbohydrate sulfotransferase 11 [Lates japonicus]